MLSVPADDTEGKGIEVAYSEMVALVLGRTLDVEVLLGLLEEVMLKAGYDLNFVSDSSGFVAGTVRVFARTRDTSEPIGVEELFRYFELVNDQLARLGVVAIIAIGHIVPPATEMRTVVAQLPHVILYPNTIDAVEGEVVLFTSLAIPGDSVGFNWKRQDGKSLPANSRIENYNVSSVLKITGVMPRDSGRYQLTATGSSGQVLVLTVNLKVTALDYRCEFNCGGNECIARKRVCDSYSDCSNGNDEITCDPRPYGRCFPKEFSCTGRCIDFPRVCDGTVDCDDQSDEAAALCLLAARTCQSDEFSCAQNQCVKRDWMCDGEYDCTGGSDEQNCGSIAPGSYCPSTHFQCRNHQCVPLAQFCDGSMHCLDGTDESICSEPVFSASLPVSSTFNVGESLSLVCEARGSPTPDITFLRDGEKLPCESRITMTSKAGIGRLVVRDFNSKDAGVYTCEARNMRGRRSSMAVVNFVDSVIEQCNDPDLTQGVPKRSVYYKVVPDPSGKACVDVVFLVDESGSMMDEHEWLKSTVPKLERRLSDISIGAGLLKNRYGLVGFGRELKNLALGPGAVIPVGTDSSGMGSDKELVVALEELRSDGVFEDGYAAIGMALDQLTFRSSCALQFILVTDEDRDIFNATTNYNYTLAWLRRAGATLNVVADQAFFNSDEKLLGINFRDNGFIQVAKTYTKMAGASVGKGYGSTFRDYVQMALATDGAAWDLNRLRRGGYTATAFA
ncbi:uncharacterized protein LOC134182022 isoform X2 [Corticium candelabrum]|uniref:uncharacterized protein LOC134182022 isoform X2 n=1 Tax=Corticium candelabrum TaxID=121492 RepID=UPI002E26E569|nr:uncharacterized protein LOC134182022 isoform X2 [Corticium candelabrum]